MKKIKKALKSLKNEVKMIILKPFEKMEKKLYESFDDVFELDFSNGEEW